MTVNPADDPRNAKTATSRLVRLGAAGPGAGRLAAAPMRPSVSERRYL